MSTWSNNAQRKYMVLVEKSHPFQRDRAKKLRSDAMLDGCITDGQYFLLENALGEAYRAGAIDALSEPK